ncbi:MAG: Mur ligase family protein, partial [Candidatus Bipolaricaulis sp.]|nr:Mur ligase family protein [Candidatus Bipolaricaulis sp.]
MSAYTRIRPVVRTVARIYRRTLARKACVVVVVGTFGKTTTTRAVRAALGLSVSRFTGRNSGVAVPAAVLGIRPSDRHAVIEVGVSRQGDMAPHARLIRPTIAVVTCIGSEHLSTFRTLEATRAEKAEMVRALPASGVAVLNGDDANVLWMKSCTRARVVTYGFGDGNDVRATGVQSEGSAGMRFTLHAAGGRYD